jgi:hypothetical protein
MLSEDNDCRLDIRGREEASCRFQRRRTRRPNPMKQGLENRHDLSPTFSLAHQSPNRTHPLLVVMGRLILNGEALLESETDDT